MQLHKHKMAYYFVIQQKGSDDICGVVNYSNLVRHPFHACHVGYSLRSGLPGAGGDDQVIGCRKPLDVRRPEFPPDNGGLYAP